MLTFEKDQRIFRKRDIVICDGQREGFLRLLMMIKITVKRRTCKQASEIIQSNRTFLERTRVALEVESSILVSNHVISIPSDLVLDDLA